MSSEEALMCNIVVCCSKNGNAMVRWYDKFVLTLCILLLELVQSKEEFSTVLGESCVLSV